VEAEDGAADVWDGFYFFFSSRRRHTRFSRDWSSDVCSSDLDEEAYHERERGLNFLREALQVFTDCKAVLDGQVVEDFLARHEQRSEERRVGKECGTGRRPE